MARIPMLRYVFVFLTCLSAALAASPTSFCKCTCFNTNSTIIPLDDSPTASGKPSSDSDAAKSKSHHQRTCNDCTKQFCLDYQLPICKDAKEDDVFTECFQRDSAKDEAVVFIFILATGGLLAWAGIGPWVKKWREERSARREYAPVGAHEGH